MPVEQEIQNVRAKIARCIQKGEPVPQGPATGLVGHLAKRQREYLHVLKYRRRRGELGR
jgi:hypothetical protein